MNHDTVSRCVCARIESQHAGCNPGLGVQSQDTLKEPGDISGNRSPFHADNREELKFRLAHEHSLRLSHQHSPAYLDYLPIRCEKSFSFSQIASISSSSAIRSKPASLTVQGLVYAFGSSTVTSKSMCPKLRPV